MAKVRLSIRKKLLLFLLLPLFAVFAIIMAGTSMYLESVVIREHIDSHSGLMNTHAKYFNRVLRAASTLANSAAEYISMEENLNEWKVKRLLRDIIHSDKVVFGAVIAFEPGVIPGKDLFAPFMHYSGDSLITVDIADSAYDYTKSDYEWYQVPAQQMKPHWSLPFVSGVIPDFRVLTYSVPIFKNRKFIGVVAVDIAVDRIDEYLQKLAETETARFVVIAKDGSYISHPEESRIIGRTLVSDQESLIFPEDRKRLFDSITTRKEGILPIGKTTNGMAAIAFFAHIPESGWTIIAYSFEEVLTATIRDVFSKAYFLLGGTFLLGLLLIAIGSAKLLAPIKVLRTFSRSIAEGKYPESIPAVYKDEFGDLSADLNDMNRKLREREEDLISLNSDLENRVALRTKELRELLVESRKLSAAVEHSPVLITICNAEGVVEYVNPEFTRVTGYTEQDAVGKPHLLVRNDVISAEDFHRYKEYLKTGRKITQAFEGKKKNGEPFWEKISVVGVSGNDGSLSNLVIVEDDISAAKRAEKKLRENADLLAAQNREIDLRNKYITDSIRYAKKIQEAVIPKEDHFKSMFPDHFLIFSPKDVVSGDFYWGAEIGSRKFFSVIDCTGHGVPGALMSMIGNTLLNEIVTLTGVSDQAEILNRLDRRVIEELRKGFDSGTYDGMDMALGVYEEETGSLFIASAYRPVIIIQNGAFTEIKGTRKSIGDPKKKLMYSSTEIKVSAITEVYLFSDGLPDQHNPENLKFGMSRLRELLLRIHKEPMELQRSLISEEWESFRNGEPQRDDMTMLGVRLQGKVPSTSVHS